MALMAVILLQDKTGGLLGNRSIVVARDITHIADIYLEGMANNYALSGQALRSTTISLACISCVNR